MARKTKYPQHRRDPKVLEGDEKSLGLDLRLPARLPIHRLDLLCHLQQLYVNRKLYLQNSISIPRIYCLQLSFQGM